MPVIAGGGIDFIGHCAEAVGVMDKARLGWFRAFALRPVVAIASAAASPPAPAPAALLASLAHDMTILMFIRMAVGGLDRWRGKIRSRRC